MAAAPHYPQAWLNEQRRIVASKLPPGTSEIWSDGVVGWAYWITDEFANTYGFWATYDTDSALWFAYLTSPDRSAIRWTGSTAEPSMHDIHHYSDGRACLTPRIGCPSLEETFARSALWCRGASCYRATGKFQFNPGQR